MFQLFDGNSTEDVLSNVDVMAINVTEIANMSQVIVEVFKIQNCEQICSFKNIEFLGLD